MMTDIQIENVKNLYAIVCNGEVNDGERAARIVAELERMVGKKFRNTQEFHYYVSDFIKRKQPVSESAGRRFRRWRKAAKMTQADAATYFRVDRRTIIRWENDEQIPSPEALSRVGGAENPYGEM